MSLKLIELQVALPRTQDAGKLQDIMQQQGRVGQEQLSQQSIAEELKKRQKVNEQRESEKLKNNRENSKNLIPNNNDTEKKKAKNQTINHPYLGNQIDYSK
ncbi:hypothetical protein ACFOZ1_06320 [Gracilibacillus marinus]|jgi:hypothetical protein|uniref:Uncharacterized protein n=1 Tax=Gracilibacillus marinus TaxID=630535 RepID=A0ABV8VV37_9BACI